MSPEFEQQLLNATAAKRIVSVDSLQSLWSGYGEIIQAKLEGGHQPSVIVKSVQFPNPEEHPRGWKSNFAHQRKLQSYQVELNWYGYFANSAHRECYCPTFIWSEHTKDGMLLILEDLTSAYPSTPESINLDQVKVCLDWLAHFHAQHFGTTTDKLWPEGTYWHLATRPEEFAAMKDSPLKNSAHLIDEKLKSVKYKTLIHGDAKLANFCFSENGEQVSAVDFQYVGNGCGMKDVVYFFSSCLSDQQCFDFEVELLIYYFSRLNSALGNKLSEKEKFELEIEWRAMYPLAWADFQRFLKGWSPEHWKLNAYTDSQTRLAINQVMDRRRA